MSYKEITISKEPLTIEEFILLRDEIATSPEGGTAMFILAFKIFAENQDFGNKCLVASVDSSELTNSADVYKGFSVSKMLFDRIKAQLGYHPYLAKSYIEGANSKNAYSVSLPYKLYFKSNPYSGNETDGKFKVFVKCSGADSDRPVTVYRNNKELWKVKEFSSLLVGIRKPEVEINDDI